MSGQMPMDDGDNDGSGSGFPQQQQPSLQAAPTQRTQMMVPTTEEEYKAGITQLTSILSKNGMDNSSIEQIVSAIQNPGPESNIILGRYVAQLIALGPDGTFAANAISALTIGVKNIIESKRVQSQTLRQGQEKELRTAIQSAQQSAQQVQSDVDGAATGIMALSNAPLNIYREYIRDVQRYSGQLQNLMQTNGMLEQKVKELSAGGADPDTIRNLKEASGNVSQTIAEIQSRLGPIRKALEDRLNLNVRFDIDNLALAKESDVAKFYGVFVYETLRQSSDDSARSRFINSQREYLNAMQQLLGLLRIHAADNGALANDYETRAKAFEFQTQMLERAMKLYKGTQSG